MPQIISPSLHFEADLKRYCIIFLDLKEAPLLVSTYQLYFLQVQEMLREIKYFLDSMYYQQIMLLTIF